MNCIIFDKNPFIVKPWFPKISYEKSSLTIVPIWVKLPRLDVMFWTESTLMNIVGYLGTILKINNATISKTRLCLLDY